MTLPYYCYQSQIETDRQVRGRDMGHR